MVQLSRFQGKVLRLRVFAYLGEELRIWGLKVRVGGMIGKANPFLLA